VIVFLVVDDDDDDGGGGGDGGEDGGGGYIFSLKHVDKPKDYLTNTLRTST